MAAVNGHAHGGRRDAQRVVLHDFLRLVDHLHLLFRIEVVHEDVDLRDEVERDLIVLRQLADGQDVRLGLLPRGQCRNLLFELRHPLFARTRDRLIGGNDNAADLRKIIEGL